MCKCKSTALAEVLGRTSKAQCLRMILGSSLESELILRCCFEVCKLEREMRFQKFHMLGLLYHLTLHDLMYSYVFVTLPRVQIFSCISQQIEAPDLGLCMLPQRLGS